MLTTTGRGSRLRRSGMRKWTPDAAEEKEKAEKDSGTRRRRQGRKWSDLRNQMYAWLFAGTRQLQNDDDE